MAARTFGIPRRLRRRVLYPLLAGGRAALAALPRRLSGGAADLAARAAFRLLPRDRGRMAEHLAIAFPDRSEAEREAIARAAFRHFGRVFVDAARLPRMSDAELRRLVTLEDPAGVLERIRRDRPGLICVGAHVGNWELCAAYLARSGAPLRVVATRFRDPRIDDMLVSLRRASGVETIHRDQGARPVLRALKEGCTLGLLIDQDTDVDGCFVPFFGREAFTTRGPGVLHLATRAPVFTLFCVREGEGYRVIVEPPLLPAPEGLRGEEKEAAIVAVVAETTRRIEAMIRRYPEQWVWWHRRWKSVPATPLPAK